MRSGPLLPESIKVAEEIVMLIIAHNHKEFKEDIISVSLGVALVSVVT